MAARRWGMRGRLWTLFLLMMMSGVFMIVFGRMSSLTPAIIVMVIFASFSEVSTRHADVSASRKIFSRLQALQKPANVAFSLAPLPAHLE